MEATMALEAINALVEEMPHQTPIAKLNYYATISTICSDIKNTADGDQEPINAPISSLLWSCASIAGLDAGNGHSIEQHQSWAREKTRKIKAILDSHGL